MTPRYVNATLSAYQRHRELVSEGFARFTDRVHTRTMIEAAGVPMVRADEAPDETGRVLVSTWVPAWSEALMEGTFQHASASWRRRMICRAAHDPEYRATALNLLRLCGDSVLRDFVVGHG